MLAHFLDIAAERLPSDTTAALFQALGDEAIAMIEAGAPSLSAQDRVRLRMAIPMVTAPLIHWVQVWRRQVRPGIEVRYTFPAFALGVIFGNGLFNQGRQEDVLPFVATAWMGTMAPFGLTRVSAMLEDRAPPRQQARNFDALLHSLQLALGNAIHRLRLRPAGDTPSTPAADRLVGTLSFDVANQLLTWFLRGSASVMTGRSMRELENDERTSFWNTLLAWMDLLSEIAAFALPIEGDALGASAERLSQVWMLSLFRICLIPVAIAMGSWIQRQLASFAPQAVIVRDFVVDVETGAYALLTNPDGTFAWGTQIEERHFQVPIRVPTLNSPQDLHLG